MWWCGQPLRPLPPELGTLRPLPPELGTLRPLPPELGTRRPLPPELGTLRPLPPESERSACRQSMHAAAAPDVEARHAAVTSAAFRPATTSDVTPATNDPMTNDKIKLKLWTKFKNERHREASNKALCDERRQKAVKLGAPSRSWRGLPNYLPQTNGPTNEEIMGLDSLKRGLLEPSDAEQMKSVTFAERRRQIVSMRLPMPRLAEKMSWLFCEEQMWTEFARVAGRPGAREQCQQKWSGVLAAVRSKLGVGYHDGAENLTDAEAVAALFDMLGKDISVVAVDDTTAAAAAPGFPHIRQGDEGGTGIHVIVVEEVTVAQCANIADAVLVWAVVHSVLAQPLKLLYKDPLVFIQLASLEVRESQNVPKMVVKQLRFLGLGDHL